MSEQQELICSKCNIPLVPTKTNFRYMSFSFHHDLPKCPSCGLLYIPEDLVKGKMAEVEMELEEK